MMVVGLVMMDVLRLSRETMNLGNFVEHMVVGLGVEYTCLEYKSLVVRLVGLKIGNLLTDMFHWG